MPLLDPLSSLVTALESAQIIPDVIPKSLNFFPSLLFSVTYPNGREVILGNELTRADTLDAPDIVFAPMVIPPESADSSGVLAESGQEATYTLVLTDPDAPSRADPKFKEFRHWVITGLKTLADTSVKTESLVAMQTKPATTPYRPPGPPPGTGVHRYVFLLFQEPPGFSIPHGAPEYGAELEDRRSWSAAKFSEQHGLRLVGANYFTVRAEV